MNKHSRVVVIGGGVMGVSLAYHLCHRGWNDVVLLEKHELTAGSTWHAAGLCTHFAHNATIMEMRATSVRLYRDQLPRETGLETGFHPCGALRVTRSADRMDEFRQVQGLGRFVGYEFRLLSPRELSHIYPLCKTDGLLGAIHEPDDGHVDPTLATNAMAHAARAMGASIVRRTAVTAVSRTTGGEWSIRTTDGEYRAEHVVNAAGTWCRDVGLLMDLDLPVVPMLHQYLVTDSVGPVQARIRAGEPELPIIRDPEESWYLRQERDGLIVGPYEKDARAWSVDGVPAEFGMELLPPDLDRVEHIVAQAMERVPMLADAGIKTIVNGPITFTPDGNPLIGPAFALPNAWLLTGSSMGVMEGGGAGSFLADWIVDQEPPNDPMAVDSRRFGDYADRSYRVQKASECFALQFGVHYPFEERPAARPLRCSPLYESQREQGAVFGVAYGWERPNWFSLGDAEGESVLGFRRPGWFDAVRAECLAVRDNVGIADLSAFSKFEVHGRDSAAFMQTLGANSAPDNQFGVRLIHALYPDGGVAAEFTVMRLDEDRFYLTSAAAARRCDYDLLCDRSAGWSGISIDDRTTEVGIIALMGPRSATVLQAHTDTDLGHAAFPWLRAARVQIAGVDVLALRISYVGECGWELHIPVSGMQQVHAALMETGAQHGIQPFGAYAINAMRMEKGYRAWGMDLTSERTPLESGLAHLVKTSEREFIGRDSMLRRDADGQAWRMRLLTLEEECYPFAPHSVCHHGRPVGIATSGSWGHRTGLPLVLAYLKPDAPDDELAVEILGEKVAARVLPRVPTIRPTSGCAAAGARSDE